MRFFANSWFLNGKNGWKILKNPKFSKNDFKIRNSLANNLNILEFVLAVSTMVNQFRHKYIDWNQYFLSRDRMES